MRLSKGIGFFRGSMNRSGGRRRAFITPATRRMFFSSILCFTKEFSSKAPACFLIRGYFCFFALPMTQSKKLLAVILLLVVSLLWGTSFKLIKEGLIAFGAWELGALRVSFACLFSLPFSLVYIREAKREQLWKFLLSGTIGIFFPAFLFAAAQTRVSSSLTGMLNSFTPICTVLVGRLLFRQRFRKAAITGVMISAAGCIVLALARANGTVVVNYFALFVVVACGLYALNVNFVKFNFPDVNPVALTSVSLLLVGPAASVFLFFFTDFLPIMQTHPRAWQSLSMVALLALLSTVIAHILFYRMLRISSPLFASSTTYIMPFVAILWGIRDGELLTSGHLMGMAFILTGVYLTTRRK